MNKILWSLIFPFSLLIIITSCEKQTTPETLVIQHPNVGTEEYYENLRAYKKSDHAIAFGWFGGWTADGPTQSHYLSGLPDSVDLVSLWGPGFNYSDNMMADLRFVQIEKGTRVMLCWIIANIGDQLGGREKFRGEVGS